MDYLATTRLGPNSSWNGTYHNFILHFRDQVRLHKSVTPDEEHMADTQVIKMVQAAVHSIPELHHVKTLATQLQATTGTTLTPDAYMGLLENAAIELDNKLSSSGRPSR